MEINKADIFLDSFNKTIGQWIAWLDDYTWEMLCRNPAAASWSLGQVYVHIIDDTNYFVEQMRTCLLSNDNTEGEMQDFAKAVFEQNGLPDMLITGPSTRAGIRQPNSKEELRQSLLSIQDEVNRLFAAHDFSTSTGKTLHPGFRFFNALEWLRWVEMHMRHHFRQKKRIDETIR